jgi:hypothetical protein
MVGGVLGIIAPFLSFFLEYIEEIFFNMEMI